MVAGTRDSFEMTTLMNLAVDFESTALENAAGGLVNDYGCLYDSNCTDEPVSSADGPMPDVDIVWVQAVAVRMEVPVQTGALTPTALSRNNDGGGDEPDSTTAGPISGVQGLSLTVAPDDVG